MIDNRVTASVMGAPIDAISWGAVLDKLSDWASRHESRYVCVCNVHSVVTVSQDRAFRRVVKGADMATPDGAPVAWMLRYFGHVGQQRINGPDLMWRYCEKSQNLDTPLRADGSGGAEPIFFYGSSEKTLAALKVKLLAAFPAMKIAGMISPPFRPLTPAEDAAIVEQINASGARVVFVCLGCPKQELWMAAHRGRIHAVMIGVGAAFNYSAGITRRAPKWMQDCGLEWLHRAACEPGRLWKRYLVTNTLFIFGVAGQLLKVGLRTER